MIKIVILILTYLISSSAFADDKDKCINMGIRSAYYWGVAITYTPCINGVAAEAETTKNIDANTNTTIQVKDRSEISFKEYYAAGRDHGYRVSGSMPAVVGYGVDCGGALGYHAGVYKPNCYLVFSQ